MATPDKLFKSKDSFSLRDVRESSNVIILRKPESVGADEVLDPTKVGGLECDKQNGMQVQTMKCRRHLPSMRMEPKQKANTHEQTFPCCNMTFSTLKQYNTLGWYPARCIIPNGGFILHEVAKSPNKG